MPRVTYEILTKEQRESMRAFSETSDIYQMHIYLLQALDTCDALERQRDEQEPHQRLRDAVIDATRIRHRQPLGGYTCDVCETLAALDAFEKEPHSVPSADETDNALVDAAEALLKAAVAAHKKGV